MRCLPRSEEAGACSKKRLRPSLIKAANGPCDLGDCFGDEETAEAVVRELYTDETFAGFRVADVDDAALRGEVIFLGLAARAGLRERDGDIEVHADGYVEFRFKGGAAAAEIFTGCDFFKGDACGGEAAHGDGQANGNAALGAWACRG